MADKQYEAIPANTIIQSPLTIDIPAIDVASYVFSDGDESSRQTPLYHDAERPSRNFSLAEAETCVKRITKGLRKHLSVGDRVLLYSENNLFFPIALWSVLAAQCVFTGAAPSALASGRSSHLH